MADNMNSRNPSEVEMSEPTRELVGQLCARYNQVLLNQPEDNRDQTKAMEAVIAQVERKIADWLWGLYWTHRDAEPVKRMAIAIERGEYRKDKA